MDELEVQNTEEQDIIPEQPETQQAESDTNDTESQSEDGASVEEEAAQEPEADTDDSFIEVKFNHKRQKLSRDDAVNYAQIGMRYGNAYEKLDRLSAIRGVSIDDLLNDLEKSEDDAYREELEAKFGDDEDTVNKMMELYLIKKNDRITKSAEDRMNADAQDEQSENERLAEEFIELQKEFPDIKDFASVPKEVKAEALSGRNMLDAYLRFQHKESKKIKAAEKNENSAKEKTSEAINTNDSPEADDEFLKGLWSR